MAKVAYLPFPVSFLHVLPARPSRHTQLVETQLSPIKVRAQAWFPPLLEPGFKAACSPTLPQPGWQGCMFPSCLPLLFNARVVARDNFLLFCVSAFCSALWAWLPFPDSGQCPLARPIHSSSPLGFKEGWAAQSLRGIC